jgi:hypothetical protein
MGEGDEAGYLDPRGEIVRLEAQIEQLGETLESTRKFVAASRVALVVGGVLLIVGMLGVVRFDATMMIAAMAAVLGGLVVLGSNRSTANEARTQLAAAEARRAELISTMELRVVSNRPTLH